MQSTPEMIAAFLREHEILVRALGPTALRVKRPGGRQLVLRFGSSWSNLNEIRVQVRTGPWDPESPCQWLEEVHGRHTIGGEPVDIGCLGHSCLNAINAHSFPRAA